MLKIKFSYDIGGKKAIQLVIAAISIFIMALIVLIWYNPILADFIEGIAMITLTGVSITVLFLTLQTYIEILDVSKKTLSFTKIQSTYNSFLDNFKLFHDLSERKISMINSNDGVQEKCSIFFQNLTFGTLYSYYKNILLNFNTLTMLMLMENESSKRSLEHNRCKEEFTKYNYKVLAFIDALFNELSRIRGNNEISHPQKITLIQLYANFILSDYLQLAVELNEEIERHKNSAINVTDMLKCNDFGSNHDNLEFDVDWFLSLVDLVDIETLEEENL